MKRRTFMGATGGLAAGLLTTQPVTAVESPVEEIEILTDEFGVSHVYADTVYGLGFGNGYVQARDRLFQMDAVRLLGRGESAEWLGPAQLASDIQVRRDLYSREEINRQWEAASETTREAIEGFCDGVNRQLVEMAASGDLPGEFAALGRVPEPWKPEDSIAFINYAIGFFGVGGGSELSNARTLAEMFENFDDEREAWAAYGDYNRVVVPSEHYGSVGESEIEPTDERALEYDELSDEQLRAIRAAKDAEPWGVDELELGFDVPDSVTEGRREATGMLEGFRFGSNAIIVDGEHTEDGRPILGAGPQMGLFKPPIPYEIGLHGAGYDAVGMGVVGAPTLVIGRTPEIAWTVTTSGDDMVDTLAVELDPDDRHRYRWDGEWHTMTTEQVTHYTSPVGGAVSGDVEPEVVRQEVARIEQEGAVMPVIAWNPDENVAYCQRVTTRLEELDGAFMWAEVGRSNSIDEFESYLSEFPFGFNFHVISEEEIAFFRTGKLPDRRGSGDPRLPVSDTEHDWGGFDVGTNIGASVRNPDRSYVVNWNNAPAPGWREGDAEEQWGSLHRVDVMERLIQEALDETGGELTREDVADIVEDCSVEHPYAPRSVPVMIDAVRGESEPQLAAMADELEAWAATDYSFRPGSDGTYDNGGMAIFEEVRIELQELVFRDKLGDQVRELAFDPTAGDGIDGGDPHAADHGSTVNKDVTLVDAMEGRTTFRWFDSLDGDTHPSRVQQRDRIIREAMRRAASTLEARYDSEDPGEWLLENRESQFTPLGAANPDRIPMSNRASFQQSIVIGRGLEHSRSVLPPSNSGHQTVVELPGTLAGEEPDRLTNQLDRYADFEYKPHPISREDVESVAVSAETLVAQSQAVADVARPATELAVKLLSIPGGGVRAVRDVPGQADRSLNSLIDNLEDVGDDALNTAADPEASADELRAELVEDDGNDDAGTGGIVDDLEDGLAGLFGS